MARPISTEHATGTSVCPPFARIVICEAFGSLRYCSFSGFWSDRRSMSTPPFYSWPFFADRGSFGQAVLKPLHLHANMRAHQGDGVAQIRHRTRNTGSRKSIRGGVARNLSKVCECSQGNGSCHSVAP